MDEQREGGQANREPANPEPANREPANPEPDAPANPEPVGPDPDAPAAPAPNATPPFSWQAPPPRTGGIPGWRAPDDGGPAWESPNRGGPMTWSPPAEPDPASQPRPDGSVAYAWAPPADGPAVTPPGRFSIGAVMGRTLDTYGSEWSLFLLVAMPYALLFGLGTAYDPWIWPSSLLGVLLGWVTTGVVTLVTLDLWSGMPPSVTRATRRTVGRLLPLLLSLVVLTVLAAAIAFVGIVIAVALATLLGPAGILAGVIVGGASLVAVLVVMLRTVLVVPAILLEDYGPIGAIRRSWAMTSRNAWRILGLLLVLGLLMSVASMGSSFLTAYAPEPWMGGVGLALGILIVAPLYGIPTAILFADLRGSGRQAATLAPAWSVPGTLPVPGPAPAPETAPAPPAPLVSIERGRWTAIVIIVGIGVVLAAAGGAALNAADGLSNVPDRGEIHAGRSLNIFDPCRPGDPDTTFREGEDVYIGGYFTEAVPPGSTARIRFYANGERLVDDPLEATLLPTECWYEPVPVSDLFPGEYRVEIVFEDRTIAEGEFTVD